MDVVRLATISVALRRVVAAAALLGVVFLRVNAAGNGKACSRTSECSLPNSKCVIEYPKCKLGRCKCADTYKYDYEHKKCLRGAFIDDECESGKSVCYAGMCVEGVCTCGRLSAKSDDKKACVGIKTEPVACSESNPCKQSPYLEICDKGTCRCRPDKVLRDGYCTSPFYGEDCSKYHKCFSMLICRNNATCDCRDGSKLLDYGFCVSVSAVTHLSDGEVCTRDLLRICKIPLFCGRCPESQSTSRSYQCLRIITDASAGNKNSRPYGAGVLSVAVAVALTLSASLFQCQP